MKPVDKMPASISALLCLYIGGVLAAFTFGKALEGRELFWMVPFVVFLVISIYGWVQKNASQLKEFKEYLKGFETQDLESVLSQSSLNGISEDMLKSELEYRKKG